MYDLSTAGISVRYTPEPSAKVVAIMKKVFPRWSRVDPPENLPLSFKYYQLAAEKGNMWGQWGLGRAYACGFGAEKNLVLWIHVAQSGFVATRCDSGDDWGEPADGRLPKRLRARSRLPCRADEA